MFVLVPGKERVHGLDAPHTPGLQGVLAVPTAAAAAARAVGGRGAGRHAPARGRVRGGNHPAGEGTVKTTTSTHQQANITKAG